jgi:hypothetical protein
MKSGSDGIFRWRRGNRVWPAFALAVVLAGLWLAFFAVPANAQLFSDRPPPVPPASVPDAGGAVSLAPPSGPGAGPLPPPATPPPGLPSVLTQPSIAPLPPPAPAQGVLSLSARYGKDLPNVNAGLVWRIFSDRPDDTGTFKMIREDRSAAPNVMLPPGNYVVHVALGLVSAVRAVTLKAETDRESFVLPAGGLRIEGRVGTSKIPQNQISFAIYKGSQFEGGDRASLVPNVAANDVVLLPEGTYYIISNYGDANSVVRSDIRVQAGKLTDVTVTHRAARITFKLVNRYGGEALANTDWAVISPAGDTIAESKGAFPRVILAEGEYKVIARNDNKVYQQDLSVLPGVDKEIEVLAR